MPQNLSYPGLMLAVMDASQNVGTTVVQLLTPTSGTRNLVILSNNSSTNLVLWYSRTNQNPTPNGLGCRQLPAGNSEIWNRTTGCPNNGLWAVAASGTIPVTLEIA